MWWFQKFLLVVHVYVRLCKHLHKTANNQKWMLVGRSRYIIYPLWTTGFDNPKNLQPTSCQHVATTEVLCLFPDLRPNQGALIFGFQTNTPKPRGFVRSNGFSRYKGIRTSWFKIFFKWISRSGEPENGEIQSFTHRLDIQTRVETWFEYECWWMSHLLHLYGCTVHIMSLKSPQIDTIFGGIQNEHSEIKWVTNKHTAMPRSWSPQQVAWNLVKAVSPGESSLVNLP